MGAVDVFGVPLSPTATTFLALLAAVLGLYVLRIPQAARMLSHSWTQLAKGQAARIDDLEREVEALRQAHNECEERADRLERRLDEIERTRRKRPGDTRG